MRSLPDFAGATLLVAPRSLAGVLPVAVLGALLGALGACASPKRAEPPPPAPCLLAVEQFSGGLLSGPLPAAAPREDAAGAEPWAIALSVAWLDALPSESGVSVASRAQRVVVPRGDEPFRTRGRLAEGVRCVWPATAPGDGAAALWETRRLDVLVPGTTTAYRLQPAPDLADGPRASWERSSVVLARPASGPLELALGFEGTTRRLLLDEESLDGALVEGPPTREREQLVLDAAPEPGGAPVAFLLPAPSRAAPRGGFRVEVRVHAPADRPSGYDAALARARAELDLTARRASDEAAGLSAAEGARFGNESAWQALDENRLQRPALLFLADQTGAALLAEVALSADPDSLRELLAFARQRLAREREAESAAERSPESSPERSPERSNGAPIDALADDVPALGWFLERSTYLWMARQAADERDPLSPELAALLLRHAGELARYPDLLVDAVQECADLESLSTRLALENRIFLEDGDPAARVRAFDWLVARGQAPEEYDPLGSRDARRAALSRAEQAAEEAEE